MKKQSKSQKHALSQGEGSKIKGPAWGGRQKSQIRSLAFILVIFLASGSWLLTSSLFAQTINYPVANLNNIRYVSAFPGATADVKIANCLADLPASGGICDARGLGATQTIAADPFLGMAPPVTPTVGSVAGGSLAQRTYEIEVTYVGGPKGETGVSAEWEQVVAANQLVTVNCPSTSSSASGSTGGATGCNVYISPTWSSNFTKQNTSTVALGGTWTEPTSGLTSNGAARPTGKQGTLLVGAGQYNVSATINPPTGWNIECVYGGRSFGVPIDPAMGTTLFWTGAASKPVIELFNVHHVSIRGCTIDGNLTAGSTGILMDATNNPPDHNLVVRDFNLYRLAVGVQIGTAPLPDANAYEVDKWQLQNGSIESGMAGSEGIVVKGIDKSQDSKIQQVWMVEVDTGIDLSNSGSGNYLDIEDLSFGTPVSTGHTDMIKMIGSANVRIKTVDAESLVNGTHFIHSYASSSSATNFVTSIVGSVFNEPVILLGNARFFSAGNGTYNPGAISISSISVSSGTVTVNTTGNHSLTTSDYVIIAGVSGTGYNGGFPVASTPSGTQFTYSDSSASGAASGGTATKSIAVLDGAGATAGFPKLTSIGDFLNNEAGWSVLNGASYEKLQEADTIIPNSLETTTLKLDAANQDTILARDAAGQLAQRNGTTAQDFCVYNTYTSSTNYERGCLNWTNGANQFLVGTQAGSGGGTSRALYLSGTQVNVMPTGNGTTTAWSWSTAGNYITQADNTYDLGAAGANRPRSVYAASRIVPGLNSVAFSTTPAFDLSKGNIQQFSCTTAGSAISPSFSNLTKGQKMTLIFAQNGSTACTVTWPANIHGAMSSASLSTLNSINIQEFVVSNGGTDLYAVAAGSTGVTGGTP